MQTQAVLEHLEEIPFVSPTDMVLNQIRKLINEGILKPGEALPSERDLAQRLGVGRGYVRDAIKKLEFYGVIDVRPNRRATVSDLGIRTLDNQMATMLRLDEADLRSLVEARAALEVQAACLAAERATDAECAELFDILAEHKSLLKQKASTLETDFLFHARLACYSHNPVLTSLITRMVPTLFRQSRRFDTCGGERSADSLTEHTAVAKAILRRSPAEARAAMEYHMRKTCEIFDAKMY